MSCSPQKSTLSSPLKVWLENKKVLNSMLFTMRLNSLTKQSQIQNELTPTPKSSKTQDFTLPKFVSDKTSLLSDEILLHILSKLPESQKNSNALVSKRWFNLLGRLRRSIKLLDWNFLISGRLLVRFPNLVHVDLVNGTLISPRNSGIFCTHKIISFYVNTNIEPKVAFACDNFMLPVSEVDLGLRILANGCPNLRRLLVINASEMGLLSVADECPTLQELELQKCNDQVLRGIAAFQNLQILRLIANVDGFYTSVVSDVGLTILAQGCKRLVKLEMFGCHGSYEGIRAIGQCCQMLEELTFSNHKMEHGWLSALSYCDNLKTLRFLSCKGIDLNPWCYEDIKPCPALERLHLEKSQLQDKHSAKALFLVCQGVREIIFRNCWGLTDDMFTTASFCR